MIDLDDTQKNIFIGSMLGDGAMRHNHKNASFIISRALADLEYLEYEFDYFRDFCRTGIVQKRVYDKRTKKFYYKCYFHTLTNPIFNKYYEEWYPNGAKIVPLNLQLTPQMCAIWFCDDGCVMVPSPNTLTLKLSTNGFTKTEVKFLSSLLNKKLHENFFVSKTEKNQYVICAGTNATINFINYIKNNLPGGMGRKITWKNIEDIAPRKSNLILNLERVNGIFGLLDAAPGKTRIEIAQKLGLLCFNNNKKCYYLRQDVASLLESWVLDGILRKENHRNTNYYYINDRQYFLTKQEEMSKFYV